MIDTLRRNAADAIQLFVVPCLIALLPWSLGFGVIRRLAAHGWGLGDEAERAWIVASDHLTNAHECEWKRRFRLLRWIERVDTWLTVLRPTRWWQRHVIRNGEWPQPGACILLTFHWGSGMWVWRDLHAHAIDAHFLARRAVARDLGQGRIAYWYGLMRKHTMRWIGGRGVLFTGGSSAAIADALRAGDAVVGMLDLPAQPGQRVLRRRLLGREVSFPFGLARLAANAGVPVVIFSCGVNIDSGQRDLHVEGLPAGLDAEAIATRYMQHLDARLRAQPAFWQLWSANAAMFVAPENPL